MVAILILAGGVVGLWWNGVFEKEEQSEDSSFPPPSPRNEKRITESWILSLEGDYDAAVQFANTSHQHIREIAEKFVLDLAQNDAISITIMDVFKGSIIIDYLMEGNAADLKDAVSSTKSSIGRDMIFGNVSVKITSNELTLSESTGSPTSSSPTTSSPTTASPNTASPTAFPTNSPSTGSPTVTAESFGLHSSTMRVSSRSVVDDTVRFMFDPNYHHYDGVKGMALGSFEIPSTNEVLAKWTLEPLRPGNKAESSLGFSIVGIVDSEWTGSELKSELKENGIFSPALRDGRRYYGYQWTGETTSHSPAGWTAYGHGFRSQGDRVVIELDLRDQGNPTLAFLNEGSPNSAQAFTVDIGNDIAYKLWVGCTHEDAGFKIIDYTETPSTASPTKSPTTGSPTTGSPTDSPTTGSPTGSPTTGSPTTTSDEASGLSTGAIIGLVVAAVTFGGIVVVANSYASSSSNSKHSQHSPRISLSNSQREKIRYWNANTRNSQRVNGAVDDNAVNDLSYGDIQYYARKNDRDLEKGLATDKRSKTEVEPFMR